MTHPRPAQDVPHVHRAATPTPRLHPPKSAQRSHVHYVLPRRLLSRHGHAMFTQGVRPAPDRVATRHCYRWGARSHGHLYSTKSREARPLPPDALLVRERCSSPGPVVNVVAVSASLVEQACVCVSPGLERGVGSAICIQYVSHVRVLFSRSMSSRQN